MGGWAARLCLALAGLTMLAACVQFFEGEVQGFVRDEVTEEGINGAEVRIFYDGTDDTSFQLTLTQTNADAGFFIFRRIVWASDSPWFGDEGDLQDVRITVSHEDYQPFDTTIRIVSGAASSVGALYLERAFYESGLVEGRIRDAEADADGEHPGINGLQVKLYVPDVAIDDAAAAQVWVDTHTADFVTNTANQDDEAGYYAFENVRWQIPGQLPEGGEDERGTPWNVILTVEDPDHFDGFFAPVQILSGEVGVTLDDQSITKRRFEGDVEGYVTDVANGDGINGVTVDVYVPDADVRTDEDAQQWVDEHDADASGNTRTEEDDDGYFLIQGVSWEVDALPTAEHPSQAVILVFDTGAYRETVAFLDDSGAPLAELTSTRTATVDTVQLARTQFTADLETYIRRDPTDATTGVNGVEVFLYYDEDDPDLSELEAFDPDTITFKDRTTTSDHDLSGLIQPGYLRFNAIGWDNTDGGALGGGRDEVEVILFSRGADFSDFAGNTDPSWQRFTLVSAVEPAEDVNTLSSVQYRPTRFDVDIEGYVRRLEGDSSTGANGVTVQLYYEEDDASLGGLSDFDPETARFVDTVTTRDEGDENTAGYFTFTGLSWQNLDGPTVPPDRDRLTLILYSEEVDFSGMDANTDPRWQRFTVTSGDVIATLPDLLWAPTDFTASAEGYVRTTVGDANTGVSGLAVLLYFEADNPDLDGVTTFDPESATFTNRVTTGTLQLGDDSREGYFRFEDIVWHDPEGASLSGGRDELSVIVHGPQLDFSHLAGNTDPRWQRFALVSGDGGNTLPDLVYLP